MPKYTPPWATLAALLAATAPATPLAAQAAHPSPWSVHLTAGYARATRNAALDGGLALGAGLYHGRGTARLGVEVTFASLGDESRTIAGFIPIPVFTPTVISTHYRQRMLAATLGLAVGPATGRVRPALLLGAGLYGVDQLDARTVRDSVTSQVLQHGSSSGWSWGGGASAGIGVTLPRVAGVAAPRLEIRLHGFLVHTGDAWTAWPVVAAGVGVGW